MKSAAYRLGILVFLLSLAVVPATAEEHTLTFSPDSTKIDWVLGATGHDVEGAFNLISGEITWDSESGAAKGTIEIDAASAKTGSDSRDETMNDDVLEIAKYTRFVFKATKVEGNVQPSGTSTIKLHGVLNIHGQDHPIVLPAQVNRADRSLIVHSSFDIPFVEWGMKDPSILFLRVEKSVKVKLEATAAVSTAEMAADAH